MRGKRWMNVLRSVARRAVDCGGSRLECGGREVSPRATHKPGTEEGRTYSANIFRPNVYHHPFAPTSEERAMLVADALSADRTRGEYGAGMGKVVNPLWGGNGLGLIEEGRRRETRKLILARSTASRVWACVGWRR